MLQCILGCGVIGSRQRRFQGLVKRTREKSNSHESLEYLIIIFLLFGNFFHSVY